MQLCALHVCELRICWAMGPEKTPKYRCGSAMRSLRKVYDFKLASSAEKGDGQTHLKILPRLAQYFPGMLVHMPEPCSFFTTCLRYSNFHF